MPIYQKIRALTEKYQVVFACSASAVVTYFVIQNVRDKELLEELIVSLMLLREENDEIIEFLDKKNLRDEFIEFAKKVNDDS